MVNKWFVIKSVSVSGASLIDYFLIWNNGIVCTIFSFNAFHNITIMLILLPVFLNFPLIIIPIFQLAKQFMVNNEDFN